MTAVAAAATSLFAFGEVGDFTHTGFEASPYVADGVLDTQKDDAGLTDGETGFAKVWEGYDAGTNASTVVKAYDNDKPVIDGKTAGNNYLYVETDEAPVTRYVKQGAAAETIGSNGIYLDTLVKFTPMDADDDASLATTDGDKIAIALVGNETAGTTNFVVRAGYIDGSSIAPTNYTMNAVAENFDYSAWHRLIVEAISDVGNANAPVGFVVYVDGTMLTYSTDVAAGDAAYVDSFNGVVKENLYTSSTHALLPSLALKGSDNYGALTSVSFKGNGSIDDIEFTATRPTVLPDYGTIVTIAWDDGVATVTIGDDEAFATAGLDYTATNITVAAGVTSLAVEATYAEGKEAGKWTASVGTFADDTWTGFSSGATLTIKSMTPLFKVGDKNYGDFKSALEAAVEQSESPATIQLLANYTGDITFEEGDIILDLAGNTLTGDSDAAIHTGYANLVITNSTATIGHVVAPDFATDTSGVAVVCDGATTLTVTAGIFDGSIARDDPDAKITIKGGTFYDTQYADDPTGEFYLAENVDTAVYTISDPDENYFTVSSGVTPGPTTYELTIPEVTDATATVTDADEQEISDLTAIAEGTVVTVTWAPTEGYKITAGETEEITMDANKTAKEPTVVAITYATLTITQVENCTIVVSNATEEVATGAKFDVDDATQLTVYRTPAKGYKLSSGYAATETITMDDNVTVTAVVEEEPEYPSYIDDEDTEAQGKYDTWKSYVEGASETVGDGEELADAYLLNCKPSEVAAAKAAFKFTSISYDSTQSKWVTPTTTSYNEREYNGTVTVKQYSDVGCTTESSTGTFFKAVLQ